MRLALYYTPEADDPFAKAGADWLGRNAYTGETWPSAIADVHLSSARRYGFHATIRAPFGPVPGCDPAELEAVLSNFCRAQSPVVIDRLMLARLGRFLALVPQKQPDHLRDLQLGVLRTFERFRRPLNPDEVARRNPAGLTERQRHYLDAWGYPFVLEDFQFHMTLTDALEVSEIDRIEPLAKEHFADFIGAPLLIDRLALFQESEPGAPFIVRSSHRFGGSSTEKIA
ncbi:DUF1045 domain-containing protein [Fulvimarina sp. 2208YS6-2-32]|uniref:DUF1045 domain-containing protein n=1 Tax=Fulvimarina uroteuthidis TaxID=3098149 RepID=A0ABU5I478_9HYPH|nr:DUF1045 domain-containing protein [Fulvimarina sp. 2208YS6-2-32]MDY8109902.1 DUF1045 domain-containing protein [Fulvimarina sp. 2208YS6-2-32]